MIYNIEQFRYMQVGKAYIKDGRAETVTKAFYKSVPVMAGYIFFS